MKKILTFLVAGALTVSLFTACTKTHVHQAIGGWDCDAKEHWMLCEDGDKMNVEAHVLDDLGVCTACGAEIIDWGDGSYDVCVIDQYGELTRWASYDSEGNLTSDSRNEITYDENGNKTFMKSYTDGVHSSDTYYAMGKNGVYEAKYVDYSDDGSYFTNEYNEDSEMILACTYDASGKEIYRDTYEYAEDEDGNRYEYLSTMYDYEAQKIYIGEYNAFGDQIGRKICDLDGTVTLENRFEYTYNEDGDRETVKEYENGRLVFEILSYAVYSEDGYTERYPEKTVDYNEDGSKIVTEYEAGGNKTTFEYDANGNLVKETSYQGE